MKVSFTSQRRANMSNWTSLNLENPVIESPFNPYMLRDIFFDQIKSQGRSLNQHTASMGWTVWIHMTSLQAKSRWGQTALKGGKAEGWVSPKSWRVDGRWVFPLSNCTRATSDSEFFFGSSFFKFFEGYIRISKALIFPISVCFLFSALFFIGSKQLWCQVHVLICTSGIAQLFLHHLGSFWWV